MSRPESSDPFGFDQNVNYLERALRHVVPQWVARRCVAVSVSTEQSSYKVGEEIPITVEFENRLPVPFAIETPRQRLWGWEVNGELEASDESYYLRDVPNALYFRAGERKRVRTMWDGRFERPRDETTITLR